MEGAVGGEIEGELCFCRPRRGAPQPPGAGIAGTVWEPVGKWATVSLALTLLEDIN